jgi:hypothetical protein
MTEEAPIACSLSMSDVQQRLKEIAEIGDKSLTAHNADGNRHLLFFRSSEETRRRLRAIVAAEEKCCPFLDLALENRGNALVLSIAAPEEGRSIAAGLAAAFINGAT